MQSNLNISRHIITSIAEDEIDLQIVNKSVAEIEEKINTALANHNSFLQELGLPLLK
jgi:type I restriction enzyme M protein